MPLPDNDVDRLSRNEGLRDGAAYLETDVAQADGETIVRNFIAGQYEAPSG